jgi:hypothetical protein
MSKKTASGGLLQLQQHETGNLVAMKMEELQFNHDYFWKRKVKRSMFGPTA